MLDAIKNQNENQLKSQLQNVDDVFQKQKLVDSFNVRLQIDILVVTDVLPTLVREAQS